MKIAITGGSGAIGSHVCDELIRAGHEAWSLDRTPPRLGVEFRQVDLTSLEATREAVRGADQIVHLAAIPDPYLGHPLEQVIGENTVTSYTVFEAAREEGMLVGISSGATLAGIAQKLKDMAPGSRVLGFNYDTGERYLSVPDFLPEE